MIESSNGERPSEVFPPTTIDDDGLYRNSLLQYDTAFAAKKRARKKYLPLKIILVIFLMLLIIYLVLVLVCGGFDLQLRCFQHTQ